MSPLAFLSLNVERSKHLDLVFPFLAAHEFDVACLQEVCEQDVQPFAEAFGAQGILFRSETSEYDDGTRWVSGVCILSRTPLQNDTIQYYAGDPSRVPESDVRDPATYNSRNRILLSADIGKNDDVFRIATTHFTWSPRGEATDLQRDDLQKLLGFLEGEREFVLAGDFNMPRAGELFKEIAGRYTDNIPPQYKTSIDVNLHRSGKIRPDDFADKMVDGLFTTPAYIASNVELHPGVSDHLAVTATIAKVKNS